MHELPITPNEGWTIVREGVHPSSEASLNTVFCVGNGRLGIRGHLPELPVAEGAGMFMAGFFDKLTRRAQEPEKWGPFLRYWGMPELAAEVQIETCIVNCPDMLDMMWTIDGEKIDFTQGELKSLTRTLDMDCGVFTAEAHWVSPGGKELRLTQLRFADLVETNRVYVLYILEPSDNLQQVEIRAGIDGTTTNTSDLLGQQRLYDVTAVEPAGPQAVAMQVKGHADEMEAAFATGIRVVSHPDAAYSVIPGSDRIDVTTTVPIIPGQLVVVERAACAALEGKEATPLADVKSAVQQAMTIDIPDAIIDHLGCWEKEWARSDVQIEGDLDDQLGIRFSIFHLLIAASRDDDRVSIGAKSLSGEGYRGMVFWDTDIHMTPFFIFTQPAMARNLLAFRCHTLDGAREKAAKYGFRGASYPWETGVSGREETEKWLKLITHQSHITADVAYALQLFVDVTTDMAFYRDYVAEVMIETGRFWFSKAVANGDTLSIPDAGGPDEFHVVCDDSAYVNNLAIYNLQLADRAVAYLREQAPEKLEEIKARLHITDAELAALPVAAGRIRTMLGADGRFEQCQGFFQLRDEIADKHGGPEPFNTQCVKQADVLMLLYLLPDRWPREVLQANWDYYEPRTVHASSLSHGVHGILAAELGLFEKADHYSRRSMGMDLHDEMNNAALGAHMAANGMNWSGVVRGYAGARPQGDRFLIAPRLPERWTRLAFSLQWHGVPFTIDITHEQVSVSNQSDATVLPLRVYEREIDLLAGEAVTISK